MVEKLWKADAIWFGFLIAYFGGTLWCPYSICLINPYMKLLWQALSAQNKALRKLKAMKYNLAECGHKQKSFHTDYIFIESVSQLCFIVLCILIIIYI